MVENPAGFWVRLVASGIDTIFLTLITGIISLILFKQFSNTPNSILSYIFDLLYALLLPIFWYGYTVGKKSLGIRIVQMGGGEVDLETMILREVVTSLFYVLTLGVGIIVSAFMVGLREDKRSIHDFVAGTYVTYDLPE